MRIAHLCIKFSRRSETFIYDLIRGMEEHGMENHVLTCLRLHAAERPFHRVHHLRVPLGRKLLFKWRKHGLGVYAFPWPLCASRHVLDAIQPDVLLAHFGGTGAAALPLARRTGIPMVVVFHAFDLFMPYVPRSAYDALWAARVQAVAISEHGRQRLIELGCPASRARTIHCGIAIDRFRGPAPVRTGSLRILTLGRLVEKKGTDDLLRAIARLRRTFAGPLQLDIWGDGPRRRALQRLAERLACRDIVRFMGAVAHARVPALLRQYDLFALPSKTAADGDREGIPITLLEAQAAGLPVVATVHAGIPEALPPANRRFLAAEGDVAHLARILQALAGDATLRQRAGRAGRAWVRAHFTLEGEIEGYLDLFRRLGCGPREPA